MHVTPDDVRARRRIPAELLFPAPGRPPRHMLMGDERRWTAVRVAARHLKSADLPAGTTPRRAADVATAALKTHEMFLDGAVPGDRDLAGALLPDDSET